MPYFGSVKVVDINGWEKTFSLEKAILMVGSAPHNDIILPSTHGSGVSALHLQLIHPQADQDNLQVLNLSTSQVVLKRPTLLDGIPIAGNTSRGLENGDSLQLGEFTLTFDIQPTFGIVRKVRTDHLGLSLTLPGRQLRSGSRLSGQISLINYGENSRCQFEIELVGLPAQCYQIDPAPILYPKSEEHLQIRFFHRGTAPVAGFQTFTLRVTAPMAYPLEEAVLTETLDVTPIYQFGMQIGAVTKAVSADPTVQPLSAVEPEKLMTMSQAAGPAMDVEAATRAEVLEAAVPAKEPAVVQTAVSVNTSGQPAAGSIFQGAPAVRSQRLTLKGRNIQVLRAETPAGAESNPEIAQPSADASE